MSEQLDFSLPGDKPNRAGYKFCGINVIIAFICLGIIAIIIIQLIILFGNKSTTASSGAFSSKELALKFENRNLPESAIEIWKNYIVSANPDDFEKARLYFRIANLYMKKGDFESAIRYFIYSENISDVKELKNEINKNILECYRKLGNISGLNAELSSRAALSPQPEETKTGELLAEIGELKITRADLDKKIEDMLELQIKQMTQYTGENLTADELSKRKEQYLRQIDENQKNRILMEWIQSETLYREAVERGLNNSPATEKTIDNFRKSYLAQQLIAEEKKTINLTETDYREYYEAHKDEFKQNERAKIAVIKIQSKETAETVMKKLKSGANFEELARQYSTDASTSKQGGKLDIWVEKNKDIPGIGNNPEIHKHIFQLKSGGKSANYIESDGAFYLFKMYEYQPGRQQTYDEVKQQVQSAKRQSKESELFNQYFDKLKDKYKVVIHYGKLKENEPDKSAHIKK